MECSYFSFPTCWIKRPRFFSKSTCAQYMYLLLGTQDIFLHFLSGSKKTKFVKSMCFKGVFNMYINYSITSLPPLHVRYLHLQHRTLKTSRKSTMYVSLFPSAENKNTNNVYVRLGILRRQYIISLEPHTLLCSSLLYLSYQKSNLRNHYRMFLGAQQLKKNV